MQHRRRIALVSTWFSLGMRKLRSQGAELIMPFAANSFSSRVSCANPSREIARKGIAHTKFAQGGPLVRKPGNFLRATFMQCCNGTERGQELIMQKWESLTRWFWLCASPPSSTTSVLLCAPSRSMRAELSIAQCHATKDLGATRFARFLHYDSRLFYCGLRCT